MSKHQVRGGDVAGLFARFSQLQAKCQSRTGRPYRLIVIHEAGLDGFWIHRTLQNANIESHVVDPASIATSRRRRRGARRSRCPPLFPPPWPRSRACRFWPWIRARTRRRRAPRRPSASPHDHRCRNRPETVRAAITAIAVLIAAALESVIRGLVAERRNRPCPRRPKGPSLILPPVRQYRCGKRRRGGRVGYAWHACLPEDRATGGTGCPSQKLKPVADNADLVPSRGRG